jgi:hypothetical protein
MSYDCWLRGKPPDKFQIALEAKMGAISEHRVNGNYYRASFSLVMLGGLAR